MKILVLGATGATGQLIVRDAAAGGHYVVALVRDGARANLPGVQVVEGDVRDEGTLASALNGCDAVISALGTGMGVREVDLLAVATRALVAAMTRADVRRLICISALGVGDSRNHGGFVFDRLFQPLLLGPAYKDKDRQEATIRASSLDWVVVRPAMLTNGAPRGHITATTDLSSVNGGKIARGRRSIRGRAIDDRHLVTADTRHPVVIPPRQIMCRRDEMGCAAGLYNLFTRSIVNTANRGRARSNWRAPRIDVVHYYLRTQ